MSSTASCRTRSFRSCRATRSSGASPHWGRPSQAWRLASASACPGSATPAASVPIAAAGERISGYTRDGGYATHTLADARYCFPLPERKDDAEIAPFLCAGLIGWRSYRMAGAEGEGSAGLEALGLYGFGAAAHILAQVAAWQGRRVYAFTRGGDTAAQSFARSLGAVWAGGSDEMPPAPLESGSASGGGTGWSSASG